MENVKKKETKTCKYCGETKSIDDFPKMGGFRCKECMNLKKREDRALKKVEKIKEEKAEKSKVIDMIPEQGQPKEIDIDEIFNGSDAVYEKPKEVKKDSKVISFDKKQISGLVDTLLTNTFDIVAEKSKKEHWKISKTESKSISDPLTNILSKLSISSKIAENSDAIALIFGVGGIMIPRLLIEMEELKRKREEELKINGQTTSKPNERKYKGGLRKNRSDDRGQNQVVRDDEISYTSSIRAVQDAIC